jgi:tetratricopeptide (TPR) repeat protein
MTSGKWLGICVLTCATLGRAETKWIRMQSPNFEVYSAAGERDTRDTLRYFERVRDFFLQANNHAPEKPVPVYVVIFGSEKEYAPYRFNQFATAYYHSGADRDYIVMSRPGEAAAQIATHEYVHLLARHAGHTYPPWLGEGLAELYSTFQSLGDKVMVGAMIPGRLQALNTEKWVPLATILTADRNSPYYNEKDKAGSLYNEGWALVHMLQLTPEYGTKVLTAVSAIASGTPSVTALEQTYGKPLSAIEKDLQLYIRGNQFRALQYPVKLDQAKDQFPASPAPMFDVKLALANLVTSGGDQESQKRLEELRQEDPKRAEPWAGLAYLAWRQQKMPEAVEDFAQAYTLGDHSSRLLWDYGRLAENGHAEDSVKVLTELLALEPDNIDARIELASGHMGARRPAQALVVLRPVDHVTPEQAPRFFYIMGFAQMQTGDLEAARVTAKKVAEYARTPQEHAQAEQLQNYLAGAGR